VANLGLLTSGDDNVAIGYNALPVLLTGSANVGLGNGALLNLTGSADENTALGDDALGSITSGQFNIGIGSNAGFSLTTTDSNNIMIGQDVVGTAGDNNTLRIGLSTGTGQGQLNRAFIQGIRGITTGVNDAIAVLIDSTGQLGTVSSSIRFKENVVDLSDKSETLMKLRPVEFNMVGQSSKSIGLIAEEVAQVFPDMVIYDKDNIPFTVRYADLPILLLQKLQQQDQEIQRLKDIIGQ
jgi:hypothetical protein